MALAIFTAVVLPASSAGAAPLEVVRKVTNPAEVLLKTPVQKITTQSDSPASMRSPSAPKKRPSRAATAKKPAPISTGTTVPSASMPAALGTARSQSPSAAPLAPLPTFDYNMTTSGLSGARVAGTTPAAMIVASATPTRFTVLRATAGGWELFGLLWYWWLCVALAIVIVVKLGLPLYRRRDEWGKVAG